MIQQLDTPTKPVRLTSTQYILALARSLPCLEPKISHWHPKRFDADEFYKMTGKWSTYERHCAMFILNVWNPGYAKSKGWRFEIFDFVGGADDDNLSPVLEWMQNPFFP